MHNQLPNFCTALKRKLWLIYFSKDQTGCYKYSAFLKNVFVLKEAKQKALPVRIFCPLIFAYRQRVATD